MITRCILPEEMKERTFMGSRPLEFNLEYKIVLSYSGDFDIHRQGGILPKTTETYRYEIGGTVIVKPLSSRDSGEEEVGWVYDNFHVNMECYLGKPYGARGVESIGTKASVISIHDELRNFCEKYFPHMGIYGNVILATVGQLPGDISKQTLADLLINALEMSDIAKASKAHKAFLEIVKGE